MNTFPIDEDNYYHPQYIQPMYENISEPAGKVFLSGTAITLSGIINYGLGFTVASAVAFAPVTYAIIAVTEITATRIWSDYCSSYSDLPFDIYASLGRSLDDTKFYFKRLHDACRLVLVDGLMKVPGAVVEESGHVFGDKEAEVTGDNGDQKDEL